MDNKLFLLLIAFIAIVLSSAIPESYEGTSTLTRKSKTFVDHGEDVDVSHFDEHESHQLDDELPKSSFGRRNRNFGYGSSLKGSKPRSRFVSVHDDDDDNPADWFKPPAFGLDLSSIIPGFQLNLPGGHSESSQTCQPIVDPRFPFFSDLCGILPQSRYSLPNFFGHAEKWQIAQSLTTIFGPSLASQLSDPACTRSLRLLVCPLLFPPCKPKRDILSVLPCQSFCQGVKATCPMPGIEHLPCEFLAPVSDVCPVNPLPYSSLLNSFAAPFPLAGPQLPTPIAPVPFPSVFGQSPISSPIPKPNILNVQPFASPLQTSTLLGQSPFSPQMTASSLLTPSPLGSSIQTPSMPSLLQLQGNSFPTTGLANNAFSPYLQAAGIYSTPTMQSQVSQTQTQTQTQQQPLSSQWLQQPQQQPLSNQWLQQPQMQQQPLSNQWLQQQQPQMQQQPLSNQWLQQPQQAVQSQLFQQQPIQAPFQQQQQQHQMLQPEMLQQSTQQPMQQQFLQQPQQPVQQQFLQQPQQHQQQQPQPLQPQLFQQSTQQTIQPQLLQQQSQIKPQYLQQLPNTLMKTIDTNKLTSDSLSSGFIDLPEIGPLADINKPNVARIFPALRSSNEKF